MYPVFLEVLIVAALGLALGSFSTALIYRVPRNIPWVFSSNKNASEPKAARSACTSCGRVLSVGDLVPVFSWLFLRGKCRQCGTAIPARYPLTEIGVVLACLGAYAVFGFQSQTFFIMAAVPFLAALLVIDLDHMILPDQLVIIVGAIGLLKLLYADLLGAEGPGFLAAHIGAAASYAAFSWLLGYGMGKMLKKDSLGFGDVKFFAVAGLWLGFSGLPAFLIISGVAGVAFALIWKKIKKEAVFPFGPALITSLYAVLLLQGSLFL